MFTGATTMKRKMWAKEKAEQGGHTHQLHSGDWQTRRDDIS